MTTTSTDKPGGRKPSKASAAAEAAAQARQIEETTTTEVGSYSAESERLVCATMLRAPEEFSVEPDDGRRGKALQAELVSLLAPEDLYQEQHQAIWSIVSAQHAAALVSDAVSVLDAAKRQDVFIGGAPYLSGLLDDPFTRSSTVASIRDAAKRIKDLSMLRKLQASLRQAMLLAQSGQHFTEVAGFVADDMANLLSSSNTSRTGPRPLRDFADIVLQRVTAADEGEKVFTGHKTQFDGLDALISGLMPEELYIIAARPSMGKTAFMLAIEQAISVRQAKPTLIFSLEMPGQQLAQRDLAREGRIPLSNIRDAKLADHEFGMFVDAYELLSKAPSFIDESPGLTLSQIRARARAFVAEYPGAVIFVDYLQLVQAEDNRKFSDENAHIGYVSKGLKALARELRAPVVALAQLNRDLERRTSKRPVMADLRGSGQIEQDGSVIMFLYRDEVYNPDTPDKGVAEVIVGKNRDGATGTVRLGFHGATQLFTDTGDVRHGE